MTRAEIVIERDLAQAAYQSAIQTGQSYTMNMGGTSRSKTNLDIEKILSIYEYWQNRLDQYDGNTKRVKFGRAQI